MGAIAFKILLGLAVVLLILFGLQELFPHANIPHLVGSFFHDLFQFTQALGGGGTK